MNKLFLAMTILILSLTQMVFGQQQTNGLNHQKSQLTEEQKIEDLNGLCTSLENTQSYLYDVVSKEQFDKIKEEILNKIPNLSDTGFFYELQRLVALQHDAHTVLENDPIFSNIEENFIPLEVKPMDGKWYLVGSYDKDYQKYLSYELTEINGKSLREILKLAQPYISYENQIRLEDKFSERIINADFLKHIGIAKDMEGISFKVIDSNKKEMQFAVKTYSWQEIQRVEYYSVYKVPETKVNSDMAYEFFSLNDDALLIRYNKAREDSRYPISEFKSELKKEMENKKYKKVIVDLRENTGGNYLLFPPVIDMIKSFKQEQNFELYSLIGKDTFSSGVIHAAQLQHYAGATLVGTPTGGNVYFYANTNNPIKLPNSNLYLTCSTAYSKEVPGYKADALYPDKTIKHTIKDYISGIDKEIETIINGAELNIKRPQEMDYKNEQSFIIDTVELKHYSDNSPYLHDIITNNSDKTIVGYKKAMLAFDKEGKPLEQYWTGPDSEKSYIHVYAVKRAFLYPGKKENIDGGWSLFGDPNEVAFGLYCITEVTFDDGEIWKNAEYDDWEKRYLGKPVDLKTIQNYYPFVQKMK